MRITQTSRAMIDTKYGEPYGALKVTIEFEGEEAAWNQLIPRVRDLTDYAVSKMNPPTE